jgi:hypothetical protein
MERHWFDIHLLHIKSGPETPHGFRNEMFYGEVEKIINTDKLQTALCTMTQYGSAE